MGAAVSKVQIARAIAAMDEQGHPVVALRISPDGRIDLLTEAPKHALASNDDSGDWVDLAGETEIPRA